MRLSYWEKKRFFDKVDVCVIGSGIVGLSTAIEIRRLRPEWRVLVIERSFLPYGASTRNAGFACFGSVTELSEDLGSIGEKAMTDLVQRRWLGLRNLRELLGDQSIGLEKHGGYEVFSSSADYDEARGKLDFFNGCLREIIGENVFSEAGKMSTEFGFEGVKGMIFNRYEAQIDTGEMMHNLLRLAAKEGVNVINGLEVEGIHENEITFKQDFSISCAKVVVCTNGFARQLLPELQVDPARAQVLVTEPIAGLRLKGTFHYDKGYYYFRNIGDRILFGGARNLDFAAETSTEMIQTEKIQSRLEDLLYNMIIPYAKPGIEMRWSGVMGVGENRNPIVKKVKRDVYCAVRMGGMGVAIGSLVGKEMAELLVAES